MRIKTAIKAAEKAGKVLMKHYKNVKEQYKDSYEDVGSIVTEADINSEKKIIEIIEKKFPNDNIYSEERGWIKKNSDYTWYIDPLDGTSNFVREIPTFGISIGLVKGNHPVLGVLYFPLLDLLVHAEKGKGAFANGKKIKVSNRNLKGSTYYAHGYLRGKLHFEKNIAEKMSMVKIIDNSAFELTQIARGHGELYLLKSVPHDVVAGTIIIREAGGKVTDHKGKEWNVNSDTIVATNKKIHKEVLRILKKDYKKLDWLKNSNK